MYTSISTLSYLYHLHVSTIEFSFPEVHTRISCFNLIKSHFASLLRKFLSFWWAAGLQIGKNKHVLQNGYLMQRQLEEIFKANM